MTRRNRQFLTRWNPEGSNRGVRKSHHQRSDQELAQRSRKEQQRTTSTTIKTCTGKTGIPPHVAVMHQIRSMGEALECLVVIQGHLADEVDARMNETLDARAIGGGGQSEA